MSVPVVGVYGLRGGTGKTTLIYHLAWMFSELGIRTVAIDLDPQSALTEHFFGTERTDVFLGEGKTIISGLDQRGGGSRGFDRSLLHLVNDRIAMVAGDIGLFGSFETLVDAWRESLDGQPRTVQAVTAISRLTQSAAVEHNAQVALVDLGPSVSALNWMAFVAITHFIVPIVPEPLSLRSLEIIGAALAVWRDEWKQRQPAVAAWSKEVPERSMFPIGYVLLQVPALGGRPAQASKRSLEQVPEIFYRYVLHSETGPPPADVRNDPMCLASIPRYNTVLQMAAELNKPVFDLKPADGAMGSIMTAVQRARQDFEHLARAILSRVGILPP